MAKIKLEIQNLNFFYKDHHALKNINLSILENNITALIGYSGSGKSTLIRTINRIYQEYKSHQATGKIFLDGQNILDKDYDLIRLRTIVGMVFQKPTPFPMSIKENIAFGIRLHESLSSSKLDERIEWALHQTALWHEVKDRLHQPAMGLSLGQQQRLCMARTIAIQPQILLFDEPTASLDPITTRHIEELIKQLSKDYTIIIVTHNMRQALRLADYTVFMLKGEIVEHGPTAKIFTVPEQQETKDYLRFSDDA
ncbi:MAG TPA: phosphate ABC transporter ATP-binding protein PstB [Candidatus Nitrosotenuis sp.]|jgi:phosphate transport system ATP-binding protein|nr:phosphate ABC transporter ATP-binding protein PstB [Candidatus Nitrosotenuis sp.]